MLSLCLIAATPTPEDLLAALGIENPTLAPAPSRGIALAAWMANSVDAGGRPLSVAVQGKWTAVCDPLGELSFDIPAWRELAQRYGATVLLLHRESEEAAFACLSANGHTRALAWDEDERLERGDAIAAESLLPEGMPSEGDLLAIAAAHGVDVGALDQTTTHHVFERLPEAG